MLFLSFLIIPLLTVAIYYFFMRPSNVKRSAANLNPLVICGPSGAGKGTIIQRIFADYPHLFEFSVSHTTRSPRNGEADGIHYHFISLDKMREDISAGKFLEFAEVHDNLYGTSRSAVDDVRKHDKVCVLDIDIQGVLSLKQDEIGQNCFYIFIKPPSREILENRIRKRGTESEEAIKVRISNAIQELEYGERTELWDAVVLNEEAQIDKTMKDIYVQLKKFYPQMK